MVQSGVQLVSQLDNVGDIASALARDTAREVAPMRSTSCRFR